jgi:hypothetical protein
MFPSLHTPVGTSTWRARLLRALDVLVAFATLRDVEESAAATGRHALVTASRRPAASTTRGKLRGPAGALPHPHRAPLRSPSRGRRPGAVHTAPQPCVTPLPTARRDSARPARASADAC